ncbi:MAG: hypothetical protein WCP74_03720 [Sphingobacteriia bacterium]
MSLPNKKNEGLFSKEITLEDIRAYLLNFRPALLKSIIVIILFTIAFAFIGYIAKVTSPKEYESNCVLYNEQGGGGSSSLQSLASLAGISTGGGADATGGDLYQLILNNYPFLLELAKKPIYLKEKGTTITLQQYFERDEEKDLVEKVMYSFLHAPSTIKSLIFKKPKVVKEEKLFKPDSLLLDSSRASFQNRVYITKLTSDDKKIIDILILRIRLSQNGKLSTLTVKMPDAILSAEANKVVLELLIKYAIRFKVSKQLENVEFLEARTKEAEFKYKESQQKLASFKDNNYNVIFQSVQSQENVLQNNFLLYSGVYNQLVTQLEQAKIQLKKDSPLFTVVQPIYVPGEVASNNGKIIYYSLKGLFIGFLFLIYFFYKAYKKTASININS